MGECRVSECLLRSRKCGRHGSGSGSLDVLDLLARGTRKRLTIREIDSHIRRLATKLATEAPRGVGAIHADPTNTRFTQHAE